MKHLLILLILLTAPTLRAQEQPWTLGQCIEYAQQNSIEVRQRLVAIQEQQVQLSTARNSRLPDLNASLGANVNFGRGLTRDNTYADNTQLSGSLGLSTSLPVFQGMRINRQIKGEKLSLAACMQDLQRAKEDVAINVVGLYLQVLFSKELTAAAERQLSLSTQETQRSAALVRDGRKPESARYESQALQAKDELTLTQCRNDLALALLNLRQALNREQTTDFDVQTPELDSLTLESLHQLGEPDQIYDGAEQQRPHIRAERLRLESSENAVRIARASLAPSIALSAGYGTNVYKSYATGALSSNFWSQLRNNSNEYIGLSVHVPIFNRRASRNNIQAARLSVDRQQLALLNAQQALRKEIEQAYYSADAAFAKYRSSAHALWAARIAFSYEQAKAVAGRSTLFDYNDAKTRMERSESDLIQAKYEFIFRSKILDYYRDRPLTL